MVASGVLGASTGVYVGRGGRSAVAVAGAAHRAGHVVSLQGGDADEFAAGCCRRRPGP